MSLISAYADWLEDQSVATLGQDELRIGGLPASPDTVYSLEPNGGPLFKRLQTGEVVMSQILLLKHRSDDPEAVYEHLDEIIDYVVAAGCPDLDGHVLAAPPDVEGVFNDADLDDERRKIGTIQITLRTYKS